MKRVTNPRIAAKRSSVIVKGTPKFSRRAYGVACFENGELIHLESFYGADGRTLLSDAKRYRAKYQDGLSLGLESPLHRMGLTSGFPSESAIREMLRQESGK